MLEYSRMATESSIASDLLYDLKLCIDESRENDVHLPTYILIWIHLKKGFDDLLNFLIIVLLSAGCDGFSLQICLF